MGRAAGPHGLLDAGKKAWVRRIRPGALQEREFRLFFTGQLVPLPGDAVTPFALAWAVLDLTGSARDLGLVIAAKTARWLFSCSPAASSPAVCRGAA